MRRMNFVLFLCLLLSGMLLNVGAAEQIAEDISSTAVISGGGWESRDFLTDGVDIQGFYTESTLELESGQGIGALSLVFDQPCSYRIRNPQTGDILEGGGNGFLHCFSDVAAAFGAAPQKLTLEFPEGAILCELRVYSAGEIPASVQQWGEPLEGCADLVLFSTHGDDEQLYFAGLLPYYAGERDLAVQVVYMTGHQDNAGSVRMHEMLNGLWAVGVRAYPVFGPFPDFRLPHREHTYREYERLGYSRMELLGYVVENLRRFRPQVAVGHDLNGEYGHGMHKVYADLLTQAVQISADAEMFPESAKHYGVWDVPKTYLHLYQENAIVMDWDQPLEDFGGMTAFQVCQNLGFPCHATQQYDQYVYWLYGPNRSFTKATDIVYYSPCLYGLYRSTVGEDVQGNDLMENTTSYAEQTRQQEAQAERLRGMVQLERSKQATESRLLRPPDPTEPEISEGTTQKSRGFPAIAAWFALLSGAAAVVLFFILKKSEKN